MLESLLDIIHHIPAVIEVTNRTCRHNILVKVFANPMIQERVSETISFLTNPKVITLRVPVVKSRWINSVNSSSSSKSS